MSGSEIRIAPGSGRQLTRSLLDKFGGQIDFTTGTWRADLNIIEYPGAPGIPFAILTTETETGKLKWLSFGNSSVIITPDPDITKLWDFYKYHYELYITGPNPSSKSERVDHGQFRLDR